MQILVTGHLGYVGTVLTPLLLADGHALVGIDSDLYRNATFSKLPLAIPLLSKDIRDIETADLEQVDAVIHLAGLSNDPLGDLDPELTMEINHQAAVRLARMARAAGVQRMVLASSCSVYGAAGEDWVTEDSPNRPVTPYAVSKLRMEEDISALASANFSPVFLRAATVYGGSPRLRFDLVLNNLVAWAFTTGEVLLKSDGSAWRPLLHVEDMARAFIAVLDAPRRRIHNQAFNIGTTAANLKISEVAETVRRTVPDTVIKMVPGATADHRSYRVNCDKFEQYFPELEMQWTIEKGARQLLGAYTTTGLRQDEFEGPRYQRVAHLKSLMADAIIDDRLYRAIPA